MPATAGQLGAYAHDIVTPDTFVVIDDILGDVAFEKTRNEDDASPHVDGVDKYTISPLLRRGPISGSMNDTGDVTQTGMETAYNENTEFQLQIRGPNFSAGVTEDTIVRGRLTAFNRVSPLDAPASAINWIFRGSGQFTENGVTVG